LRPFARVLVANRGEIAIRVMHTLREMEIESVAVFSDADRDAPHVLAADQARRLGPAPAAESYLRIDRVVEAALASGCQAIHPGYGFLSENAAFADACAQAGLVFIGPPAEAMRVMGSKLAARRAMQAAGVPVVPGGPDAADERLDDQALSRFAAQIGYPVLVKASAGGGGKGMRLVHAPAELPAALALCRSEALLAFGDGTLYIEGCLARPRHIEFQVFGDAAGRCFHLRERECSVQRRHQKVIEETPSTAVDDGLRTRMGEAAAAAARAVGYRGAGTVEFLLDATGAFYFLEMNTRLQVEHPVTEELLGIDLVAAQLLTAAGQPLPWAPEALAPRGHAIECRLYAEDPAAGFLPQAGPLLLVRLPQGPGVRVDGALREGDEVTAFYDPMLAKIIATGADRAAAVARMERALEETIVLGVPTNRDFLLEVIRHKAFRAGEISTHFIAEHLADWTPPMVPPDEMVALAALAASSSAPATGSGPATGRGSAPGPWERLGSLRFSSTGQS
jgi:acetyl-CoA carboxylase biotin carboxylase subunit